MIAGASFIYNADRSYADIASVIIQDESGADITSRYEISMTGKDIYTTRRPITISILDASKIYDGTPLTSNEIFAVEDLEAEVYSLLPGHVIYGDVTGSQTAIGKTKNTYEFPVSPKF